MEHEKYLKDIYSDVRRFVHTGQRDPDDGLLTTAEFVAKVVYEIRMKMDTERLVKKIMGEIETLIRDPETVTSIDQLTAKHLGVSEEEVRNASPGQYRTAAVMGDADADIVTVREQRKGT